MKIQYQGHSCFILGDGLNQVIIDPLLLNNPNSRIKPEDVSVKAVIVTHGHADHVGDALQIAKRNNCPIVANYEVCMYFAGKGAQVAPMHIGGTRQFDWGCVKMTQAFHGSGLELENGDIEYGGMPAGVLVTMAGTTFYHAGDTAIFGDMKMIGELNPIDVAALPIGDVFTMGPRDAKIAASWLKADLYLPMHYNTFPPIQQDANQWVQELSEDGMYGIAIGAGETIFAKDVLTNKN